MKNKSKKFAAFLMTGVLCFAVLTACSSKEKSAYTESSDSAAPSVSAETPAASDSVAPAETSDVSDSVAPAETSDSDSISLGEFTTQDINGETYNQDMFKDYELTLVNVFATWCSPCVAEIPDLEKLNNQMEDQGVHVVGVLLDILNAKGEIEPEGVERAKFLAEQTGAAYPFLVPDSTYFNGRLIGIESIPETFFVDKNGNIVGETYSGSRSLEEWISVVEKELANLKKSE